MRLAVGERLTGCRRLESGQDMLILTTNMSSGINTLTASNAPAYPAEQWRRNLPL
ncbi:MAG: hypothetical protein QXU87_09745 [Candidatus Caldarchaeum sp.]